MTIYSKSDKGLKRNNNQDAFAAGQFDNGDVFAVVCDGMGGANGGNIASECAVKVISEYIVNSYSPKMNSNSIENMLRAAVDSANIEIFEKSKEEDSYAGMGTTVVAAILSDNLAHIVHVGDSRAYLVTADDMVKLTNDHSIVQNMIDSGEISEDEAKSHPKKNIITRAVGAEDVVFCDYDIVIKPDNNILLICTDGLTNYVSDADIMNVLKTTEPSLAADKLIELANEGGGGDNITVVLVY